MCGGGGSNEVKETSEQKALAKIAAERWNYAQQEFAPYQQKYMDKVEKINSQDQFNKVGGEVNQSYAHEFGKATDNLQTQMTAAGVDPSSGKFQTGLGDMTVNQGSATADGQNRADTTQSDRYVAGLENVVNMGQGKASSAEAGLGDVAALSGQKASRDAVAAFQNRQDNMDAVGTIGGMAASYGLANAGTPTAAGHPVGVHDFVDTRLTGAPSPTYGM